MVPILLLLTLGTLMNRLKPWSLDLAIGLQHPQHRFDLAFCSGLSVCPCRAKQVAQNKELALPSAAASILAATFQQTLPLARSSTYPLPTPPLTKDLKR